MSVALSAYRSLMRSARIAFQGDAPILAAAQGQIRSEFRQKASLDPTDDSIPAAIQRAEEVAKVLRENVVQGKKVEEGQDRYTAPKEVAVDAGKQTSAKSCMNL
ncbi:Mitochondrial zinc maintenance protein 1, mitochondrial [Neonectria punicea]|uniref:Mitochondrial zinc maintenance protein 1, mitochondrial n=1 Tax=Neonectria punicea TaxID=979145 RepID=A0ABR1HAV1_9HYPO